MNIEQVCKDAIAVVERYLTGDVSAYDMQDELSKAQEAVDKAWDIKTLDRKSHCMCRAAWHACLAAKNDKRITAEACMAKFWEQV